MTEYKILLVDDEPDILEFLSYNLKKEGFEVFTAQNGNECSTFNPGIGVGKFATLQMIWKDAVLYRPE